MRHFTKLKLLALSLCLSCGSGNNKASSEAAATANTLSFIKANADRRLVYAVVGGATEAVAAKTGNFIVRLRLNEAKQEFIATHELELGYEDGRVVQKLR